MLIEFIYTTLFVWAVSAKYLLKLYARGISIYCVEKFRIDALLISDTILGSLKQYFSSVVVVGKHLSETEFV